MKAKWILLVLALAGFVTACLPPSYPPEGPGGPRVEVGGPGISSGQVRQAAREAVVDYIFRRYGRDARPSVGSVTIRAMGRAEAEVVGRVKYYRIGRRWVAQNFRCRVDRYDRRVYDIDLY